MKAVGGGGKNKKVEIRGCYRSLIDSFFFSTLTHQASLDHRHAMPPPSVRG